MSQVVPVLMYHIIAPVDKRSLVPLQYTDPGHLERQMKALKALRLNTVLMGELGSGSLPAKSVVLTYDDAYANFYTAAVPIMKKYGFKGTTFVVGNQIGGTNAWDVALGDVAHPLMTADQIRMSRADGMEIGAHTMDHVKLARREPAVAWKQIADSKEVIEEVLGESITSFCYPYGSCNEEVRDLVEKAGFTTACTTVQGVNTDKTDRYLLFRYNCKHNTTAFQYVARLFRAAVAGRA
ncbi:MAG TPA: polysaccharide deacetylase family protein [Fimbriimonas sp.]|nr:polysaccharide deacetylase family protein [Fimbriimonas sp.]